MILFVAFGRLKRLVWKELPTKGVLGGILFLCNDGLLNCEEVLLEEFSVSCLL